MMKRSLFKNFHNFTNFQCQLNNLSKKLTFQSNNYQCSYRQYNFTLKQKNNKTFSITSFVFSSFKVFNWYSRALIYAWTDLVLIHSLSICKLINKMSTYYSNFLKISVYTSVVFLSLSLLFYNLISNTLLNKNESDTTHPSVESLEKNIKDITSSFFKEKILKKPAGPQTKLNLTSFVWRSPITQNVLRLLDGKRNGFFVEAGAFDGELLSNTLELEALYGWEGLLVEPDPSNLARLYTKNRKAWIAPVCLSTNEFPQKVKMLSMGGGILTHIPRNSHPPEPGYDPAITFEVHCFPLFTMLEALNRTTIDYLSLDVEGSEISILQSIPFDKVSIKVISVEMNGKNSIFNFLTSKGYRLDGTYDLPKVHVRDAIFIHEDQEQPNILYKSMPG